MSHIFRRLRFAVPVIAALALVACGDDDITEVLPGDIVEVAQGDDQLTTLVTALTQAELVGSLQAEGPFTVFAPRNAAFEALGADVVAGLLDEGNALLLSRVLQFHVIPGARLESTDLSDGQTAATLEGGEVSIGVDGDAVTVNGANVVEADIDAENGVIHIIDGVLTPSTDVYETAVLTESTTTLASAVLAGELNDDLMGAGPFTVFAPDNDAFAALDAYTLNALLESANLEILQKVLGLHVIAGQKIMAADLTDGQMETSLEGSELTFDLTDMADPMVNGVSITATDVEVSNGVIHLVDEVLLPEFNIVETATITEGFGTLAAAIEAAGLEAALASGSSSFTVFAPTDAAFEALGGTVDLLLLSSNQPTLQALLEYHVLESAVASTGLSDGLTVTTRDGGSITFTQDPGATNNFRVNGADITVVDIQTSNGVIHVIDAVLTQGLDVVQRALVTEQTTSLATAVLAADLASALEAPGPFTVFAPTNAAFEALGTTGDNLLDVGDVDILAALQDVLQFHVVSGQKILAEDLSSLPGPLTSLEGGSLTFDLSDAADPKVNGVSITSTDIEVENGVIHLIDEVMLESLDIVQRAYVTDATSTLSVAIAQTEGATTDIDAILSGAGPYTVFAPVNAAFEALGTDRIDVLLNNADLLAKVLAYHAVSGEVFAGDLTDGTVATLASGVEVTIAGAGTESPTVNGVDIIATDIETENGVIHLIDGVLTENLDIVDVATVEGYATLVQLVDDEGLTPTLRGNGPGGMGLTVFAPTEAAFAALGGTIPANIADILTYHVVDGTVAEEFLFDGQVVSTLLSGENFTVNIDSGTGAVTITDAQGNTVNVTVTDIEAANGVIHEIDAILLPTAP